MLDTMTLTKGVAALCGSLLIFLLGSWAGEELYHVGYDSHGYDDHHDQAYKIDTGEEANFRSTNFFSYLQPLPIITKVDQIYKNC